MGSMCSSSPSKHNVVDRVCDCQEWEPSAKDESCDCCKKPKHDLANFSINVGEDDREIGSDNVLENESVVLGVHRTTIAEGSLQNESNVFVEDGNIVDRDLSLEAKHKVFLSHSGVQKCFVEQLCIDLERSDRYPFFDKRWSSFPMGVPMPEVLFNALQQCEVGILVL